MIRVLTIAWIGFWSLASLVAAISFYQMYWRWRDCFDDQGRCFVAEHSVVYHEQSGISWGAFLFFSLAMLLLGIARWKMSRPPS